MESLEEEKIIKDIRNLFRLEKLKIDITIKDIINLFRLEKENKAIKDSILRDIRNVFKLEKETKAIKDIIVRDLFENEEEESYYKPVRVSNFGVTIILNTKLTVIEIKHCHLKNILIKLDHI